MQPNGAAWLNVVLSLQCLKLLVLGTYVGVGHKVGRLMQGNRHLGTL
jgi:hypothetical protein